MAEKRMINIEKDLKGKTVLMARTGKREGEVVDMIVHPGEGRMLALEIHNENHQFAAIPAKDYVIGPDAVMTRSEVGFGMQRESIPLNGGIRILENMKGAKVVTQNGKFLGNINAFYLDPDENRIFYYISESPLKRFLGRGFYLPADKIQAYSQDEQRLIVPADTEEHYALSSLDEIVEAHQSTPVP